MQVILCDCCGMCMCIGLSPIQVIRDGLCSSKNKQIIEFTKSTGTLCIEYQYIL